MTFLRWLIIPAMALSLMAQTTTTAPKKRRPRPRAKTAATQTVTQADIQSLRDALAAQQQQIQLLQQQLRQREQQIQQAQSAAQEASSKAESAAATAGQETQTVSGLQSTVKDLRSNSSSTAETIQNEQKRITDLENPTSLHFRGVTLTPGGFVEAAGLWRSHNENASLNSATADSNLPLQGSANTKLTEFRGDARQSRLTLLAETKLNTAKLSGYYEVDFLGAAPTANQVESNSFNLRQRQLWAQVDFDNGFTFTGGQMWSLVTSHRKGLATRAEFLPTVIDPQYNVGFNWARQLGARLTKNWSNKVWFAVSVENPETATNVSNAPANILGLNTSSNALSPSGLIVLNNVPGANGVSTNLAPDLAFDAVVEPGWGHFEIKGVGRSFRDRIAGSAAVPGQNISSYGGGVGASFILPVIAKKLDVVGEGLFGNGIGRYGAGVGPDVTIRPDGKLIPIRGYQGLGGLESHPTPKLDVYAYVGGEYYQRTAYISPTATTVNARGVGYGSPFINVANCAIGFSSGTPPVVTTEANFAATCSAQSRYVYEAQPGFWYRFYRGPKGTLQFGGSYSYTYRKTYPGLLGNSFTAIPYAPKGIENMIMTSFRYILP